MTSSALPSPASSIELHGDDPPAALPDDGALICPACGLHNNPQQVFCANHQCHKALGEFRYVLEEVAAESSSIEKLADRVTRLTGEPRFVIFHVLWFLAWFFLNSDALPPAAVFDAFPYGLLGIVLAVEATLITLFLLISNNRQSAQAERRAELDYEVNVRSYRLLERLDRDLRQLHARLVELEQRR